MFYDESWKPIYFGFKRSRSRVTKTVLACVFLHCCECWLFLVSRNCEVIRRLLSTFSDPVEPSGRCVCVCVCVCMSVCKGVTSPNLVGSYYLPTLPQSSPLLSLSVSHSLPNSRIASLPIHRGWIILLSDIRSDTGSNRIYFTVSQL